MHDRTSLPLNLLERLRLILPSEEWPKVITTFHMPRVLSVRINTLKTSREVVLRRLQEKGIVFQNVSWYPEALILQNYAQNELGESDWVKKGWVFAQNLSGILPVLVLNPQPADRILDMCAAPGSKTTQIASLMRNEGSILALEAVRDRFYRLKAVCALLGATNVDFKLMDARCYRFAGEYFDRILVDAPCSSEGRFKIFDPKTFAYWSPRKIREMVQKQRGLLMTASHLVRPGGWLVYSTCTFAPEENEGVVDWLLRKGPQDLELVECPLKGIGRYPALTRWGEKVFDRRVSRCWRVLPDALMEGFFLALFRRKG